MDYVGIEKEKLTKNILIRTSETEKNALQMLADMYAEGNLSAYMMDRSLYSNRRFIKVNNFELSNRRIKKGTSKDAPPSVLPE